MMLSFSKKQWDLMEPDRNLVEDAIKNANIPEIIAKILINRNISPKNILEFLSPKLKTLIPEPYLILDMEKAVERVYTAIIMHEKILIFGDYDVDGVSSTYLLIEYLKQLGISAEFQIPNRRDDGYGLNSEIIELAGQRGVELVIAVDSGIGATEQVKIANNMGVDVVILDHHAQVMPEIPKATAVVNPNRLDQKELDDVFIKSLCAAGLVFIFLIALQRKLRESGFFSDKSPPDLYQFLDTVSLATLCDVMDLKGINRAFVCFSLKNGVKTRGIASIMRALNIEKLTSSEDFSFFVGPLINAAGRIGSAHSALDVFIAETDEKSYENAIKLIEINKKRKNIEKILINEAFEIIDQNNLHKNQAICVFGDGNTWDEGVIGIIAGKIKDRFQKPSFVIAFDANGFGKGSARSVDGLHLGNLLEQAKNQGVIEKGGGHSMAGGFSIIKSQLDLFNKFLHNNIQTSFTNTLKIDYLLSSQSNLKGIATNLLMLEPFGKGMERPIFCIKRLRIKDIKNISNNAHIIITFNGETGGNIRCFLFNVASKMFLVNEIKRHAESVLDIACTIKYNQQFGETIIIEDIRISA